MATPIKSVPILYGETAAEFIRQAEERERNPQSKPLTAEQEEKIAEITKQLRDYKFPWDKQS